MSEETQRCPGCKEMRPLELFCGLESEYDPLMPPPELCEVCRRGGPSAVQVAEPSSDPLAGVNMEGRRLIKALVEGAKNIEEAAREVGISVRRASELVEGTRRKSVRHAYQRILEEKGLTLEAIAQGMKEGTQATRPLWNRKTEEFDIFDDNTTRLKAWSTLAKHADVEEPEQLPKNAQEIIPVVIIQHNLMGPKPEEADAERTIVAEYRTSE